MQRELSARGRSISLLPASTESVGCDIYECMPKMRASSFWLSGQLKRQVQLGYLQSMSEP